MMIVWLYLQMMSFVNSAATRLRPVQAQHFMFPLPKLTIKKLNF